MTQSRMLEWNPKDNGGAATLATHRNQLDVLGEEKYIERQHQIFGNDMKGEQG